MRILPEHEIEAALGWLCEAGDGAFTVEQLIDALGLADAEERTFWSTRLTRELATSGCCFHLPGEDRFVSRELFFRGREFLIVPSEEEIARGVLVIGHRAAPFIAREVFPTEIALSADHGRRRFEWRTVEATLAEVLPLYMLLGAEEIFDCLIADHDGNRQVLHTAGADDSNAEVRISVVDMAAYYRDYEFEFGDALVMRVVDYNTGVLEVDYLSGLKRSTRGVGEWKREYAAALDRVIDLFGDSLSVPDQLSHAFFVGGPALLTRDGASIDEFYASDETFEINFDRSGTSSLVRVDDLLFEEDEEDAGDAGEEDGADIPEGFGISSGTVASLEAILREQRIILSLIEIDSFIYDQLAHGVADFDDFHSRAFGHVRRDFADEAQETVFDNLIEERFEELGDRYDREGDRLKKELRSEILELVEARLELVETLEAREISLDRIPADAWKTVTEGSVYFNNVLQLLNSPGFDPSEEEVREIGEAVEETAQAFEAAVDAVREEFSL